MELENIGAEITLISLLLLITSLFFLKKLISSRTPPLPPGPFPWPIIGNLHLMAKNPHTLLANLAKTHGPLMSLRLGTQLLVVGSSPAAATEILKTHDRLLSGRYVSRVYPVSNPNLNSLSLGFAKECSDQWRALKSVCRTNLFTAKALEAQRDVRERKVRELIGYLGRKEGEAVRIGEVTYTTFSNMMCNAMFSKDLFEFEGRGRGKEVKELLMKVIEFGGAFNISDYYPVLEGLDLQGMRKKGKVLENIPKLWMDIVAQRRVQGEDAPIEHDLLDVLLHDGFTDAQINQLIQEILSASADTSSLTVEWTMSELIKNPETMLKLRNELAQVVGKVNSINESHLPRLPYLQACLKETLRLHPTGPLLLPHRATETCVVMGYTIPKHAQVLVNMWAIGRDPVFWEDPNSFKPQRFLDSELDFKGNDFEFIPFSAGRRICCGMSLAAKQIPLALASLVQSFDWVLPDNMDGTQLDMSEELTLTLRKKHPLVIIPKLRM